MRSGNLAYTPSMGLGTPGDCNCTASGVDPISFQVTDLVTHVVTTGELFDVTSNMGGPGTFTWNSNSFALNATDFDFSITVNSPFTVQHGTAVLQVRNGIITVSTGTGMFANLFPTVGSAGNFLIPFTTNFSLDYNLGNFNGDPLAVQFTLANSGSAMARIDSDPSTGPPTDPPNDPPSDPNPTSTDLPEPATWATGGLVLLLAGLARRR